MDEKKELCSAIACFIEKYWRESKKVIKPKCQCVVHGVGPVQIEEDSLTCVRDNLYTFEGSANVTLTDVSKVTMN